MATNGISLTQRGIKPIKGQAAFLPNQPIIHNCVYDPSATTGVVPGDAVTFATTDLTDLTVLKKATTSDAPVGVVAYNAIKSNFVANDRISIYPLNSFVYLPAGAANLSLGVQVGFNQDGQVVQESNNAIGVLWTKAAAVGDLVVVQITQNSYPSSDAESE